MWVQMKGTSILRRRLSQSKGEDERDADDGERDGVRACVCVCWRKGGWRKKWMQEYLWEQRVKVTGTGRKTCGGGDVSLHLCMYEVAFVCVVN